MDSAPSPNASVPRFPPVEDYGSVDAPAGVERVSWAAVESRLADASFFWLATTRSDGRPHTVPIGGVWHELRLFFNMAPQTVTAGNVAANPAATVHLDDPLEVAIVEGTVNRLQPAEVPEAVLDLYGPKYGSPDSRAQADRPGLDWYALEPATIMAWSFPEMRATAMRWRFPAGRT